MSAGSAAPEYSYQSEASSGPDPANHQALESIHLLASDGLLYACKMQILDGDTSLFGRDSPPTYILYLTAKTLQMSRRRQAIPASQTVHSHSQKLVDFPLNVLLL